MILLDTDIFSALMREPVDAGVLSWLDRQAPTSVWTSAITVMEISYGLQILPAGKRRTAMMAAFDTVLGQIIEDRIASFDAAAARHASELMSGRRKKGKMVDLRDTMIAGVAMARFATLATRNTDHFQGLAVPVVNPWKN
jgi:predicted nucleic acid-binding protein